MSCHADAAGLSNIADTGARRQHETADGYAAVVAKLDPTWRVIECHDRLQWIIQRRKKGGADRPWRAVHYCRTRAALTRLCATSCGRVDLVAWAALAELPEHIEGGAA